MSHRRRTNPFRKSPKSPFDENGPNHAALRRGLEWLQTHDSNAPSAHLTEEARKPPEPPANEPPLETQLDPIEAGESETAPPQAPPPEPIEAQPAETEATQTEMTESEISDTGLGEEAEIAAAAANGFPANSPSDFLGATTFPKHDPPDAADPERHQRKCAVCQHPDREEIEEEFIHWTDVWRLAKQYNISDYRSIHRHARALGLLARRRENCRGVLDRILERGPDMVTVQGVIQAIRAYSCLTEDSRWVEPSHRMEYHITSSRTPNPALEKAPAHIPAQIDVTAPANAEPAATEPDTTDPDTTLPEPEVIPRPNDQNGWMDCRWKPNF